MKKFIDFLFDLSHRLYADKYLVAETRPRGNTPAEHDFRQCRSCGKHINALNPKKLQEECPHCNTVLHKQGVYTDSQDREFELKEKLYPAWIATSVTYVLTLLISVGIYVLLFDPVDTDKAVVLLTFITMEVVTRPWEIGLLLALYLVLVIAIYVVWVSNRASENTKNRVLFSLGLGLITILFSILLWTRFEHNPTWTNKYTVVAKENLPQFVEEHLGRQYTDGLEAELPDAYLADIAGQALNILPVTSGAYQKWRDRRTDHLNKVVRADHEKLPEFQVELQLGLEAEAFAKLYMNYVENSGTSKQFEQCRHDPWNVLNGLNSHHYQEFRTLCKRQPWVETE